MRPATFITTLLTATSPALASQYQNIAGRATTDTCANIVGNVGLPGIGGVTVPVNTCLCLTGVVSYVANNLLAPLATVLIALGGESAVDAQVANLITATAGGQICTYPDNSAAQCTTGNPCSFSCTAGFTLCNGLCIPSSIPCTSGIPRYHKRRDQQSGCKKKGQLACGILGRGTREWECVDPKTDLESCGGCLISLSPRAFPATGKDCTTISHASDVSCIRGACRVQSCKEGYKPSEQGDLCVSNSTEA